MRCLSDGELLGVWERGTARRPDQRALDLLCAACPREARADLARLTVGQRDARLLLLREMVFGARLTATSCCPSCGGRAEMTFAVRDVLVPEAARGAAAPAPLDVNVGGYALRLRPPDSDDLAAAAEAATDGAGTAAARRLLLGRCVVAARKERETADSPAAIGPADLPAGLIDEAAARIADLDPQADVRLDVTCPDCGRSYQEAFDILSFLWTELDAWARRTLRQVHDLARAYGWSEAETLAVTPARRRIYLQWSGA